MGKWDLNLEDLLMVVNFFSKVTVDEHGAFTFHSGASKAGSYVELFAPMDVLVVLTALQHPMDPTRLCAAPGAAGWRQAADENAAIEALLTRPENSAPSPTPTFCPVRSRMMMSPARNTRRGRLSPCDPGGEPYLFQ
jgi:hypothetical protein